MTTYELFNNSEMARGNWKLWVAKVVCAMTRRKADRELTGGYGVKQVKGLFQIVRDGAPADPYPPMDAETLYSWMVRLPLAYWQARADEIRNTICK